MEPVNNFTQETKRHEVFFKIFNNSKTTYLLIISVLTIGLIAELNCGHSLFSSSGAILIMIAIYSVYVNHNVSLDLDIATEARDIFKNAKPELNVKHIYNDAVKHIGKFNKLKNKIARLELIAALLGTFIWAFGSLMISISLYLIN